MPAHDARERFLAIAAGGPFGQRRVGAEDALKGLRGTHHGGKGGRRFDRRRASTEKLGGTPLNIILVSGATARVRSLTLDWRHWTLGGLALAVVFIAFTRRIQLPYAPLCGRRSSIRGCRRSFSPTSGRKRQRTQELVHGHLNAMALRLGELQARMMRLDGLGERLAKIAGLKPQEFPSLQTRAAPGRGGAVSLAARRARSRSPSSRICVAKLGRQVEERTDQLGVLEALLVADSANRKFMPTLLPIIDGWFSSNFGYRIDPFNGLSRSTRHRLSGGDRHADRRRGERQGHRIAAISPSMVRSS